MSNIMTGQRLGLLLCEALDIDPTSISSITIVAKPGEVALVQIARYLREGEARQIAGILRDSKDGITVGEVPPHG